MMSFYVRLIPLLYEIVMLLFFPISANDFGLFLADEDPKKGVWLESGRTLEYYLLRNGVSLI